MKEVWEKTWCRCERRRGRGVKEVFGGGVEEAWVREEAGGVEEIRGGRESEGEGVRARETRHRQRQRERGGIETEPQRTGIVRV